MANLGVVGLSLAVLTLLMHKKSSALNVLHGSTSQRVKPSPGGSALLLALTGGDQEHSPACLCLSFLTCSVEVKFCFPSAGSLKDGRSHRLCSQAAFELHPWLGEE